MSLYEVMYLIGGAVCISCLVIISDPIMSRKIRLSVIALLVTVYCIAAYLVLGDTPVP